MWRSWKRIGDRSDMIFGDRVTDWVSRWTGSWSCIWVHTAIFAAWFPLGLSVDLLTNVVSLEAIYLCVFLLMSGNRADAQRQKLFEAIDNHTRLTETHTDKIADHTDAMDKHFAETHSRCAAGV